MFKKNTVYTRSNRLSLFDKIFYINWHLLIFIIITAAIGIVMLYSAGVKPCPENMTECSTEYGSWSPWAYKQLIRFIFSVIVLFAVAVIDIKFWLKNAYIIYLCALFLLILVEFIGVKSMGARRWINLGFFNLQPSEVMKIALILALARYFHSSNLNEIRKTFHSIIPISMVLLPVLLIIKQPDLGTALLVAFVSVTLFFAAGVQIWKFAAIIITAITAAPIIWTFGLHNYQKQRILTFLNPESDPLGAGYHIMQSKIALGSGGFSGKGLFKGTQSHLNFLPEKQTDFLFAMIGEELGFFGSFLLIMLFLIIIFFGYAIAYRCRNNFGKFIAIGVTTNFFLYFVINIAMVTGLIPVVGVPLPLISYGGTVMLTLMFSFGLLQNTYIHGDIMLTSSGD